MRYLFGQKIIQKTLIFLSLCFLNMLYAENVDSMLKEYNQKNDLSQKTIDENKGHLILFTRERLEKMHAKTLKDVFKTTPAIYYHENRYALPDPLGSGGFEAYNSNFIRIYVDGVEITQGWMGSGLMLYGDLNIDFVDHIEFYYASPSFEASTEPALLTVFLYSKDPGQDSGGKINLIQGSRGYNSQSISYGEQIEDFSYMINFSHTNAKRETIENSASAPLSRDFKRTQLFSYVKNDEQIFHLQVMKKNTDSLAGMSWDATPLQSEIDYLNVHMDYGIKISEHWRAQLAYDWLKTDMAQKDEYPLAWADALGSNTFNGEYKNSTFTAELTYKENIGDHHITAGFKGRYKELDTFERDGKDALVVPFTSEEISSLVFQDQYALTDQELLTFGISYNHISRNGGVQNDDLLQLRLGYIYSSEQWSYKTYLYRSQFALEPFTRYLALANPQLDPTNSEDVPLQTTIGFTQEVSYVNQEHRLDLKLYILQDEDGFLGNNLPGVEGNTKYFTTVFTYDYDFDLNNKMNLQLYYAHYKDIVTVPKLEDVSGYLSFINTYEDFDFYNGVIWHKNSIDWKNYYDVTSAISWNIKKDFTVTLKGQNLIDKAKKTNLSRVDPATGNLMLPLSITPIDQRITIELEYIF